MKTEAPTVATRARAIAEAAAQWRDPSSSVRIAAREALAGDAWPAAVVETALDNVLWDLDESRALDVCSSAFSERAGQEARLEKRATTLVILPGNIIGPATQSAFCAAVAGAHAILKASSGERYLAGIVSRQFEEFGPPLAGCVEARHWRGGDLASESAARAGAANIIVFGDDATIDQIRTRAGGARVIGYGHSYSIGYVYEGADVAEAAAAAALDICLFDQRGCMSPQTIYVGGDPGRALLFAHALARELGPTANVLPRADFEADEAALVSDAVRRLALSATTPLPHGLDTLMRGPSRDGAPEFVVALEAFGQPTCIGFGRIAIVKPAPGARDVATQLKHYARPVETIGLAAQTPERDRVALRLSGARRLCSLGEMQRPPFGYRPAPSDFIEAMSSTETGSPC